MPYVKHSHRQKLDPFVEKTSDEIVESSASLKYPQEIGQVYYLKFLDLVRALHSLVLKKEDKYGSSHKNSIHHLAEAIFEAGKEDGGFWAGDLNYAITRMIQLVPRKLVHKGKWEKEFRYWTYAVTAGALERTALSVNGMLFSENSAEGDWIITVLIGVFLDIKDEYKRRVNVPYEIEQTTSNGDCYDVIF
jgi:hypothetical protein